MRLDLRSHMHPKRGLQREVQALPQRGVAVRRPVVPDWRQLMDRIKPLFTATATAKGGRNGHTQSSDGFVSVDLGVPKEMGGPGRPGTTTPEHLFAAAYAACFGSSLDYVGKQHRKDASAAEITCAVTIGPRDVGGFGLAVRLRVQDSGLPHTDLLALATEAHEKICPYSNAIRGNVDVQLDVIGM